MKQLVGIAGALRSGKDTIAEHLVRRYFYRRIAFADALKDELLDRLPGTLRALWALNGNPGEPSEGDLWRMVYIDKPRGVRELLQEYGSEVRRSDDESYWINAWRRRLAFSSAWRHVAPDVRFINEAITILGMGGVLIKVIRPGHEGDSHQSERGLDGWTDWDLIVYNDGSIEDLQAHVDAWLEGR